MKYMYSRYFGRIYEVNDQYLEEMNGLRKFVEENKSWVDVLHPFVLEATEVDEFDEEEALKHPLMLARRLLLRKPITKDKFIVSVQFPKKNTKGGYLQINAFSAVELEYDNGAKCFERYFEEAVKKGLRIRLRTKTQEFDEHDMSYIEKIGMGGNPYALEYEKGKLMAISAKHCFELEEAKKELLEERQFILSKKFKRNATKEEFDEAIAKLERYKESLEQSHIIVGFTVDGLIKKATKAQGTELEQYFRNKLVYETFKNVDKNDEEANKFLELEEEEE